MRVGLYLCVLNRARRQFVFSLSPGKPIPVQVIQTNGSLYIFIQIVLVLLGFGVFFQFLNLGVELSWQMYCLGQCLTVLFVCTSKAVVIRRAVYPRHSFFPSDTFLEYRMSF